MIEREGPIHVSNVMLLDPKDNKPTRVGIEREDGKAVPRRRALRDEDRLMSAATAAPAAPEDALPGGDPPAADRALRLLLARCRRRTIEKITLNMGVGDAKQDSKALKAAQDQLATIAGQQPSMRRARKSIAAFKLREGMPVGVAVTLRGERAYEFLDRLISIAIPRIRDFRGLNSRSFDGRGNYSMGVREQIIFPEIDYDTIDQMRGLDITITTSAQTDVEAFALLSALGMPFSTYNRPAEFDQGDRPPTPTRRELTDGQDIAARQAGADSEVQDARLYSLQPLRTPRAVYRKFGLCRICLRELAHKGQIPGMTKSSW